MKNTTKAVLLFAAATLIGYSCRKQENRVVSTPAASTSTHTIGEIFSALKPAPQKMTVQAGTATVLYGRAGTRLGFYPNSFKDASGNIITSGDIAIELVEMYKPGDMIANCASTVCGNSLLSSTGQVYIKATKDGKEVFANKYSIGFRQSAESSQPMQLFYSGNISPDSITTWNVDDSFSRAIGEWVKSTARDTTLVPGYGTVISIIYKFDSCTNFYWVNSDVFYGGTGPKTSVVIHTPDDSYDSHNTAVFVVFPSVNGVVGASGKKDFSIPYFDIPIGMNIKVLLITKRGNDYYYAEKTGITVTDHQEVSLAPALSSLDDINARLSEL